MQLLAKFKKILYMEFRATLNFRKFTHTLFYRTLFMEYCTRSGSKLLGLLKDYLEFHITK